MPCTESLSKAHFNVMINVFLSGNFYSELICLFAVSIGQPTTDLSISCARIMFIFENPSN